MQMTTDRERWNARFAAGEAQSADPDPFLIEACSTLQPGNALDLAGGAGRHAIWLAKRGWRVLLADISDQALAIAAQRSAADGVGVLFRNETASETVAWATRYRDDFDIRFELIFVFWFLARDEFPLLPPLLAPGGLIVYKTFTVEHPRFASGDSAHFALQPGELRTAFPTLETVLYREESGVAELIARAR